MRWLMVTSGLLISVVVQAATADDPLIPLKAGMPAPVVRWMDRMEECNHWAGEEGYDAARAREIAKAVKKLRCDQLDRDEQALLKQYGKQAKVRYQMAAAKQLF